MKSANILFVIAAGVLLFWLLHSAKAALAPFVLGAVTAYIMSPLAEKLEQKISPAAAAAIVVSLIIGILLALPLALTPIFIQQISSLIGILPALAERAGNWLGEAQPHVVAQLQSLDLTALAKHAAGVLEAGQAADAAGALFGFFGQGVSAVSVFFTFLVITPLAAFYFVRDRHSIAGELADALPPRWRDEIMTVVHDLDGVLGEFLHGQLAVICVMAALYSAMLWFAGLEFALTIGVISGVLVFIPYLGFIIGITLATIVAAGQFESLTNFVLIWVLMGVGTAIESLGITPWLVGERIGLHPLLILFALMVLGGVWGFVGVLIALPVAAILLVLFRHLRRRYIGSEFYGRSS